MLINSILLQAAETVADGKEFSLLWSLIVPGVVLLSSVIGTYLLYRHFNKKVGDDN